MEEKIGTRKTFVSKVFVTVIALTMIVPLGLMIITAESAESPIPAQAPAINNIYVGNTQINLAAAQFDTNTGPIGLIDELSVDSYPEGVNGYYIVQFNDVVKQEWKARLEQMGATVGFYVPFNAYVVKMSEEVKAQVESLDHVQYVGIYQPAFKITKFYLSPTKFFLTKFSLEGGSQND